MHEGTQGPERGPQHDIVHAFQIERTATKQMYRVHTYRVNKSLGKRSESLIKLEDVYSGPHSPFLVSVYFCQHVDRSSNPHTFRYIQCRYGTLPYRQGTKLH